MKIHKANKASGSPGNFVKMGMTGPCPPELNYNFENLYFIRIVPVILIRSEITGSDNKYNKSLRKYRIKCITMLR